MSRYELNKLSNILMKAAKAVYDNEEFPVGVLAVKAKKLAEAYPTDSTVVGCSNFLRRRADSKSAFISRAELKSVYNRLYSKNNKFAASFKKELGLTEVNPVKTMSRDLKEGESFVDEAYGKLANPLLSEQLESALLKDKSLKLYSAETARKAKAVCARELNNCGALPKQLSIVAGQPDVLICQAAYDTPKGKTHILIPVEIKNESALLPSMFLSIGGFVGLNENTVKDYLNASAGKNYKVDVQGLLQTISEAKNGKPKELSEVEQIVMKTASAKGTLASQGMNSIIMQEVDLDSPGIDTPTVEAPEEVKSITAMLSSDAGAAEMVFGKTLVEDGRNLIINAMRGAGYSSVQVAVSDNTKGSISYAVAVDGGFGFNVPVKIVNRQTVK
jgi:hypothetical protein